MKKTTKKLVSLLTILAFMLTALVPSFAFAADPEAPSAIKEAKAVLGGATVSVKADVNAGDVLELQVKGKDEANFKSFDPEVTTAKVTEAGADKEFTFDVPGNIQRDAEYQVVLKPETGDAITQEVTVETVTSPDPAEFNNRGSYAYFKDAATEEYKDTGLYADANEIIEPFIVEFADENGKAADYSGPLYVWAEVDSFQPDARFRIVKGIDDAGVLPAPALTDNVYKYDNVVVGKGNELELSVKFANSGVYRVYVSTADPFGEGDNKKADGSFKSKPAKFNADSHTNRATIGGVDQNVEAIGIESVNSPKEREVKLPCGTALWYDKYYNNEDDPCCRLNDLDVNVFTKYVLVDPNDTTKSKVNAYIYTEAKDDNGNVVKDENGNTVLERVGKGKDVTITTNRPGITVTPEKAKTDRKGRVELTITGKVEGEYIVYVEAGGCRVAFPVKVTPLRANTIEKVEEPEGPIAANDNVDTSVLSFRILDIDGNVVKQPFEPKSPIIGLDGLRKQLNKLSDSEYLHGPVFGVKYDGDFLRINEKPANSKLKIRDLELRGSSATGEYDIYFKKDLVPGHYEIEVRLDNGQKAIFKFEAKEFGTAKELKISYPQKYVELGYRSGVATIQFVDENGVKKDARRYVSLGANGYALEKFDRQYGVVTVKNDEKYLGDTITVTAVAEKEGLIADTELVVTDGKGGNETLTFDPKSGPVNKVNRSDIQVVDSKGNKIALGEDKVIQSMNAVVVDKSDKDAVVTAGIDSSNKVSLKKDGTAKLVLKSDKATSADIKVTIVAQAERRGAIHTTYYRGTVHYVFSDKAEFAGRTVVMTINSNQVIVDNNIVTIDTAAIIKNERTFVPFRALAEALGAEVDYDNDTRVVTAKMEGKTVTMTVDKDTYTVDGKEAKLDVAPYIQDSRAMIPVRFAAEALGYKVTPTYHADGTTASVAFQK